MTSRTEELAKVLTRAGPRRVYGYDARGHGGVVIDLDGKTDGWRVPVSELVRVCVEGDGQWTDLPTVPEVADEATSEADRAAAGVQVPLLWQAEAA